jgi:hypothetical protein
MRPTPDEIEAWAAREHRRRAAWLEGPREDEKQDWARQYRWRAVLGLEESRLGPTSEEINLWAERERRRRAAWLAGPSDAEKKRWAAQRRRAAADESDPRQPPSQDEIEEWAAGEQQRREQWLAGPSEAEKEEWARRQGGRMTDELLSLAARLESEIPETTRDLLREGQLAAEGALYALTRAPLALWSYLVRAGRAFENEFYDKPRRRRVRY